MKLTPPRLNHLLVVLLLTLSGFSLSAQAELNSVFMLKPVVLAQAGVNLQQAAGQVRKKYGGKVVKAATVSKGGRQIHQIRLVKEGRVKTVQIDASTGQEIAK